MDNDNYRDWKREEGKWGTTDDIRDWLQGDGKRLKVTYVFDRTGRFVPSAPPPERLGALGARSLSWDRYRGFMISTCRQVCCIYD